MFFFLNYLFIYSFLLVFFQLLQYMCSVTMSKFTLLCQRRAGKLHLGTENGFDLAHFALGMCAQLLVCLLVIIKIRGN